MARALPVVLLAAASIAGCAAVPAVAVPAAGQWDGIAWEVSAESVQYFERAQFTFTERGAWTASIGGSGRAAAGTVRFERGLIILEGAEIAQPLRPAYYVLAVAADGTLYGMTLLQTSGKGTKAAVFDLRMRR